MACCSVLLNLKIMQLSLLLSLPTCSSSPSPRKPQGAQVTDTKPESQPHKIIERSRRSLMKQVITLKSNSAQARASNHHRQTEAQHHRPTQSWNHGPRKSEHRVRVSALARHTDSEDRHTDSEEIKAGPKS